MIEANARGLWETPGGVDAKNPYASVPVDLFRIQPEFGSLYANMMRVREHIHPDMSVSSPVSVFLFTGNISLPQV